MLLLVSVTHLVRIHLHLCRPVLAAVGILAFLDGLNTFLWPQVVATSEDKHTLPVALALCSTGAEQHAAGPAPRRRGDRRPAVAASKGSPRQVSRDGPPRRRSS
jgi:hypothetical protein